MRLLRILLLCAWVQAILQPSIYTRSSRVFSGSEILTPLIFVRRKGTAFFKNVLSVTVVNEFDNEGRIFFLTSPDASVTQPTYSFRDAFFNMGLVMFSHVHWSSLSITFERLGRFENYGDMIFLVCGPKEDRDNPQITFHLLESMLNRGAIIIVGTRLAPVWVKIVPAVAWPDESLLGEGSLGIAPQMAVNPVIENRGIIYLRHATLGPGVGLDNRLDTGCVVLANGAVVTVDSTRPVERQVFHFAPGSSGEAFLVVMESEAAKRLEIYLGAFPRGAHVVVPEAWTTIWDGPEPGKMIIGTTTSQHMSVHFPLEMLRSNFRLHQTKLTYSGPDVYVQLDACEELERVVEVQKTYIPHMKNFDI